MKIKVIKKINVTTVKQKPYIKKKDMPLDSKREMVSTVNSWIKDFQRDRSEKSKHSYEIFFPQTG